MNLGNTGQEILAAIQPVVTELLSEGYPSIKSTAARIGISVRTLQRRLAESGFKYGEFVAQLRFERACRDLEDSCIAMAKISARLGYKDPSSFSRAFSRWAGMSPRQYRRQQVASTDDRSIVGRPFQS